jgi:ATP-dependent Clp protease ATP-binding subunit ClpB
MNIDFNSFTEKSAVAVQEAQNLARSHGQQEIDKLPKATGSVNC